MPVNRGYMLEQIARNRAVSRAVAPDMAARTEEEADKRSWWEHLIGKVSALDAARMAHVSNIMDQIFEIRGDPLERGAEFARLMMPAFLGTSIGRSIGIESAEKADDIAALSPLPTALVEGWKGRYDPAEEFRESWGGDIERMSGVRLIEEQMQRQGLGKPSPWLSVPLGIGAEIITGPPIGGAGVSSLAKARYFDDIAKYSDDVLDVARFAEMGLSEADIAKYGDEVLDLVRSGAARSKDLPSALLQDAAKGALRRAAEKPLTKMPVTLPIFRRGSEESAQAALTAAREAAAEAGTELTAKQAARITRKYGEGVGPRLFGFGKAGERIEIEPLTRLRDAVFGSEEASRIGLQIGPVEIPAAQDVFDAASFGIKWGLREKTPTWVKNLEDVEGFKWLPKYVEQGLSGLPHAVLKIFNRFPEIYKAGDPFAYIGARQNLAMASARKTMARQGAIEMGRDLWRGLDDTERVQMNVALNSVLDPTEWRALDEAYTALDDAVKAKQSYLEGVGLGGEKKVAETAARKTAAAERAAERLTSVEGDILRAYNEMSEIGARYGMDDATAARLERVRSALTGEAKGIRYGLREVGKDLTDARDDLARFVNRRARYSGEKIGVRDIGPAPLAPPRTLDEYIQATHGIEGSVDEHASAVLDELRSYLRSIDGAIDDGGELGEEMARTFEHAPGLNNLRKSHRFNARKRAVSPDEMREHLAQMFPEYTDMTEADFIDAMERVIAQSKTAVGQMQSDDLLDVVGIEKVVDELAANVEAALSEGNVSLARKWQHLADDAADRMKPWENVDPWDAGPDVAKKADTARRVRARVQATDRSIADMAGRDAARAAGQVSRRAEAADDMASRAEWLTGEAKPMGADIGRLKQLERKLVTLSGRQGWMERGKAFAQADMGRMQRKVARIAEHDAAILEAEQRVSEILRKADWQRVERFIDDTTTRLDEAGRAVPDVERAAKLKEMARELKAINDDMLTDEWMSGIATRELLPGQRSLGYVYQAEPGRMGFLESLGAGGRRRVEQAEAFKRYTGIPLETEPTERGVVQRFIRSSAEPEIPKERSLKSIFQRAEEGVPTNPDIAELMTQRALRSGVNVAKADFVDDAMKRWGTELADEAEPLAGEVVYTITRGGDAIRYSVPDYVKDFLDNFESAFTRDPGFKQMLNIYDRIHNAFKRMATSWNPMFHGRNLGSNEVLLWLEDIGDMRGWEDAIAIARGAEGTYDIGKWSFSADEFAEFAQRYGVKRGMFGPSEAIEPTVHEMRQIGSRKAHHILNPSIGGGQLGTAIEDTSRMAGFINALNKGLDPEAAAALVDKALYNYTSDFLTSTERNLFKRAFSFYSWIRQNLPHMVERLAKEPEKFVKMGRVLRNMQAASGISREDMPEWQREGGYVGMPVTIGGKRYTVRSSLPIEDLEVLAAARNPIEGIRELVTRSSPLVRSPVEMGLQKEIFTGADIPPHTRAPGYVQRLDEALQGSEFWNSLKQDLDLVYYTDYKTGEPYLAGNSYVLKAVRDFAPFFYQLGKFTDTRDKTGIDRVGWMTGVRMSEFDQEAADDQQLLDEYIRWQETMDELRRQGLVR